MRCTVFQGQWSYRGARYYYRRDGDRELFVVGWSLRDTYVRENEGSHPGLSEGYR